MNILKGRTSKAIVFALAAVLQLYVSGGFVLAATDAPAIASKPDRRQGVQGRLTTTGDNPVSVNGNTARTGETIFSGQQIQTPAGTGASVYLAKLGRVDMAPETSITLSFGESHVSARLAAGCAILTPGEGVEGVMEAKGETEKATSAPVSLCVNAEGAVVQNQQQEDDDKKKGGGVVVPGSTQTPLPSATGGGLGTGGALAITGAVVGAFAIISHELISDSDSPDAEDCGNNPSPFVPCNPTS